MYRQQKKYHVYSFLGIKTSLKFLIEILYFKPKSTPLEWDIIKYIAGLLAAVFWFVANKMGWNVCSAAQLRIAIVVSRKNEKTVFERDISVWREAVLLSLTSNLFKFYGEQGRIIGIINKLN